MDEFPNIILVTLFNLIVIYCDKAVAKPTVDKLPEMEQNDNNNELKRVELLAKKKVTAICLKTSNPNRMSEILSKYMGDQSLKQKQLGWI